MNSPGIIKVTHRGQQVYIDQIEGDFAQVQYVQSRQKARVSLTELEEDESAF
jgi:hypothetical protein